MIIEGIVVPGKQLGRTIGFPTANIRPLHRTGDGPDGVYAALLESEGKTYFCMVNIGHHPTLPEGGRTIEAHLLDYTGDLYGGQVRLETIAYLRPETKFSSLEELQSQLERDKINTYRILSAKMHPSPGIE